MAASAAVSKTRKASTQRASSTILQPRSTQRQLILLKIRLQRVASICAFEKGE
jgi:hypothetical protein